MRRILFIAFSILATQTVYGQGGDVQTKTLLHDGVEREYLVYVPSSYTSGQDVPLVLNFHGGLGNGNEQMLTSGMNTIAEQEGFLVAYPNAIEGNWSTGDHNLGFSIALLDALVGEYSIDASRVFATGKSQGGVMSYLLAVTQPDKLAAIASVSGVRAGVNASLLFPQSVPTVPERPVPMLHMHGTQDPITPYDGGTVSIPGFGNVPFPPSASVIADWASNNGCGALGPEDAVEDIYPADESTVSVFAYQNCASYLGASGAARTADVVHYRINGAAHSWPVFEADREASLAASEERLGEAVVQAFLPMNSDISASAEIWSFFQQHELPASAIPEPSGLSLSSFAVVVLIRLIRRRNR